MNWKTVRLFPSLCATAVGKCRQDSFNIFDLIRLAFFSLNKLMIRYQSPKITDNFIVICYSYLSNAIRFQRFLSYLFDRKCFKNLLDPKCLHTLLIPIPLMNYYSRQHFSF